MEFVEIDQFAGRVGEETGVSEWFMIDQDRIDAFADVTLDHQFIHVDPDAAAQTPFGTTIAHGFLTLSLTTRLMTATMLVPERMVMAINYGSDRLRFIEPVGVGSRIRARTRLLDITARGDGRWLVKNEVTIEIEDSDRPALTVEALTLFITS